MLNDITIDMGIKSRHENSGQRSILTMKSIKQLKSSAVLPVFNSSRAF